MEALQLVTGNRLEALVERLAVDRHARVFGFGEPAHDLIERGVDVQGDEDPIHLALPSAGHGPSHVERPDEVGDALDAMARGIHVLEVGHQASEEPVVDFLVGYLRERLPTTIPIEAFHEREPFEILQP